MMMMMMDDDDDEGDDLFAATKKKGIAREAATPQFRSGSRKRPVQLLWSIGAWSAVNIPRK
jgi:hypothetical protein